MSDKKTIKVNLDNERSGKPFMTIYNTRGAGLTVADINNKLSDLYGGGVYAVIINNSSGELTDKISKVEVYDICDLPGF